MAVTKPTGTWTYEDLFSLPDDGRRYEIIEGVLYEMPSPSWDHATTIMNLIALLLPVVSTLQGLLRTAPLDVFFPGADPVQPDLVILLPDGPATPTRRGVQGAPALVIEVISPTNRGHDLVTKRALYGRAGVREFWLVDPTARTVEILVLDRNAFPTAQRAARNETVISPLLGNTSFPLSSIFAGVGETAD
jgi:Uma2 family endonuclease